MEEPNRYCFAFWSSPAAWAHTFKQYKLTEVTVVSNRQYNFDLRIYRLLEFRITQCTDRMGFFYLSHELQQEVLDLVYEQREQRD